MTKEDASKKWRKLVDLFEASGRKTARAWCTEQRICYNSFVTWRKRLKNAPILHNPSSLAFIELQDTSQRDTGIKIHRHDLFLTLSNDFDETALLRCLKILEKL